MKSQVSGRKSTLVALLLSTAVAAPAWAQEAAPPPDESGVGDIVVTAQKRSESAQRIPVSVDSVGGEALARAGVKDLFQAVTLVPGVVFSRAPDDGLALTFRGLGTAARPQAFEQSVALFTDGVFIGKGRLYSTSFFDVERMEFIKGTQSTLLGKNASIGAISVITRQPGKEFAVDGRAGYEFENRGYTLDGGIDVPLGQASGLRIAGHYNDLNGWVRNDFTGHKGPQQQDLGLRATIKTDVGALRVTGSYQYANNDQIGASYQLVGGTLPAYYGESQLNGQTSQFTSLTSNGDSFHRTRSHIGTVKGELDLGGVTLVSQTSYVAYKLHFIDDFDFSRDDSVNFLRDEKYHQFTAAGRANFRRRDHHDPHFDRRRRFRHLRHRWHRASLHRHHPGRQPRPDHRRRSGHARRQDRDRSAQGVQRPGCRQPHSENRRKLCRQGPGFGRTASGGVPHRHAQRRLTPPPL